MTTAKPDAVPLLTDVRELLRASELADIIFYEVSASRISEESEDTESPTFSMEIMTRTEPQVIEIRCKAHAAGAGGRYVSDASALFSLAKPVDIAEDTVREFAEKVGVMAVYPYIRESITQGGARLGLDRPVLPLLRAGEVKFNASDQG
ncbi:hypothetical protein SRABI91_04595 [Rhodococcoides fascians]|nr:hypothetical protein SRABI91_04595 [Rhodococcus fascians]